MVPDLEDDYMSDEFLKNCTNDVPGISKSRTEKRQHELFKKKTVKDTKPLLTVQMEKLKGGLEEPISKTNKGFLMLEKMGFKQGTGLGKANTGISQPITIKVKNDKQGLGCSSAIESKVLKRKVECSVDDYRTLVIKRNKDKEIESDLRKSQRICHQLDVASSVADPVNRWFWPREYFQESNDDENSDDEDEDEDEVEVDIEPIKKLEMITDYLRNTFHYCIWCGIQYNSLLDLRNDCPGSTRSDH